MENTKKCSETKAAFIANLKALKTEAGLSNVAFADKCGLNTQDIQRYINGDATPSIDKLVQIASAFGRSTDWLLGMANTNPCNSPQPFAHNFVQLQEVAAHFCATLAGTNKEAHEFMLLLAKMFDSQNISPASNTQEVTKC